MFTSCYSRIKLVKQPLRPVCISAGRPRWYHGDAYMALAPRRSMLKLPALVYDEQYDEMLAGLCPEQVFGELGENAVLRLVRD